MDFWLREFVTYIVLVSYDQPNTFARVTCKHNQFVYVTNPVCSLILDCYIVVIFSITCRKVKFYLLKVAPSWTDSENGPQQNARRRKRSMAGRLNTSYSMLMYFHFLQRLLLLPNSNHFELSSLRVWRIS